MWEKREREKCTQIFADGTFKDKMRSRNVEREFLDE